MNAASLAEFRDTCWHEAGHAAAALALGIVPTSATAQMVDVTDPSLADHPDTVVGHVMFPPSDGSPESLRKRAIIAIAGKVVEGVPGWPPRWPLSLAGTSPDERKLGELVRMLGLDQRGYHDLIRDSYALVCSARFDQYARVIGELLERRHHLDSQTIKAIRRSVDDDADRDEDGVISDAQVERDIAQLRRQQAEEHGTVITINGDGPAKAIREEARERTYEALCGTHVSVAEFECT